MEKQDPFQKPANCFWQAVKSAWQRQRFWLIILAGVFVLILFLLVNQQYRRYQNSTSDHLIELAPVDSLFYFSARQTVWPKPEKKIADLPIGNFYSLPKVKETFGNNDAINDLLSNCSQAALVIAPGSRKDLEWIFIFELKDKRVIAPVLAKLPNYLFLSENILAVSTEKAALEKIVNVKNRKTFSLQGQVDQNKLGMNNLNLYLNTGQLKSLLKNVKDLPDKIVEQLPTNDIYGSLNWENNQWQFEFDQGVLPNQNFSAPVVNYLPADFGIYVSDIYLFTILNALNFIDDKLYQSWQKINNFSAIKGTSQEKLLSMFNQPADLIVFRRNQGSIFNFDFILALSAADQSQIAALESAIQNILARRLPQEVNVKLPDDSEVIEFVARPDDWQWQTKNIINNWNINYLKEPVLKFELSYAFKDGHLYLSNSADVLTNFILNQNIAIKEIAAACGRQDFFGRYWVVNGKSLIFEANAYLPKGLMILKEEKRGLGGCFYQ